MRPLGKRPAELDAQHAVGPVASQPAMNRRADGENDCEDTAARGAKKKSGRALPLPLFGTAPFLLMPAVWNEPPPAIETAML